MSTIEELVQKEIAARLRRMLYWARINAQRKNLNMIIAAAINSRIWPLWGYSRLADCLQQEFKLNDEETVKWTLLAIKKGHEDERLYCNQKTKHIPDGCKDNT
jgi:hypothetical protein